jgi:dihydroceramidase
MYHLLPLIPLSSAAAADLADCAEIVNSITNVIFICLAIRGMRNCYREGHDPIFFVAFMGYFVVGVGSFMFHSTLWCELSVLVLVLVGGADECVDSMQLVDELSMIYSTSLMLWGLYTFCTEVGVG